MKRGNLNLLLLLVFIGLLISGIWGIFSGKGKIVLTDRILITQIALIAGAYTWIRMRKENLSGSLLCKLQKFILILAIVSGILMMIKFDRQ